MTRKTFNVAIVGFGLSGKVFHAPFIHAHKGFQLHTIVTSGLEAGLKYPDARIVKDIKIVMDDPSIDVVSICTPNEYHFEHAKYALESGKHVILEKPVATSSDEFKELIKISGKWNKRIFPFQNRRWDGDFQTVTSIIASGSLGKILDFESHFDRFTPTVGRASWRYSRKEGGGTLFDLGSHLIDQAVTLFGLPEAVFCRLFNQRENSMADDSFDLKLIYPGLNVTIKAGVFVKEAGPRFAIHGTNGSFVKFGLDPQENALRNGKVPSRGIWMREPVRNWGMIHHLDKEDSRRYRIKTLPGNYMGFFEDVYKVLATGQEPHVTPSQVLANLIIIEKAIQSSSEMKVIKL